MSRRGIWRTLGIDATGDRNAIRQAYAAKLKQTSPEDDAEGFQALRAAYEAALRYAPLQAARQPEPPPLAADDEAAPVDPAPMEPVSPEPEPPKPTARPRSIRLKGRLARPPEPEASPDEPAPNLTLSLRAPRLKERLARQAEADASQFEPEPETEPEAEPGLEPPPLSPKPLDFTASAPHAAPPSLGAPLSPEILARQDALRLEADHRALCRRLEIAARDPNPVPGVLVAAFRAVIDGPGMEAISVRDRTEVWLAELIAANIPRTDPILDTAVVTFGWASPQLRRRPAAVPAILARRVAVRHLDTIASSVIDERRPAVLALTRPLTPLRKLRYSLSFGLDGVVRGFLAELQRLYPDMRANLNAAALAWWEARLARPHLPPAVFWLMALGPLPLAIWNSGGAGLLPATAAGHLAVYAGGAALVGLGALAWLHAIAWPRRHWREGRRAAASPWLAHGWAPAALAVVVAAALIPPGPVAMGLLCIPATLVAVWALITGEADLRDDVGRAWAQPAERWLPVVVVTYGFQLLFVPGLWYAWWLRALFAFAFLGVAWLQAAPGMPPGAAALVAIPLAAAAFAFTAGSVSLLEAWRQRFSARAKLITLAVLGGASALAAAGLIVSPDRPGLALPAMVVTALCVLVHKTPAAELDLRAFEARHIIMRVGWFVWPFALTMLQSGVSNERFVLRSAGLWLISGVVATVIPRTYAALRPPPPPRSP